MAESRSSRMLQQLHDQGILEKLDSQPKYETTKGLSVKERETVITGKTTVFTVRTKQFL